MKLKQTILILNLLLIASFVSSCSHTPNRRCHRYWGRQYQDSKQVHSRDEFLNDEQDLGYVPLTDEDAFGNQVAVRDRSLNPPSRVSPGDIGSRIPGIDGFEDPKQIQGASKVFQNIQFPYNSSLIKDKDSLNTLTKIATYLDQNPDTSVFIEGHCDERGAEAYNLALGARRANAVRNLLIKDGVGPDRLFTISYGKERPIAKGNDEESMTRNRRAQFKLYQS